MTEFVAPLAHLIEQFEKLPGVGHKSARRLAFHILNSPKSEAVEFAEALIAAKDSLRFCERCNNLSVDPLCDICQNQKRDFSTICVVESSKDLLAIERLHEYRGSYFVLNGVLSPINNISAEDLDIQKLMRNLQAGGVTEVILATNPSIEGEATAMYISKLIKPIGITVTRLANGLPVGGDLEFTDEATLIRALNGRTTI